MSSGSDALPLSTNGSGERPFRVMVADDGKNAADIMGMFLKMEGYEVMVVYSGEEAVEAAGDFDPQVILMDISMPGMDGLEATRAIREREQERGEPGRFIVALTAGVSESERLACREAGMDEFLGKPFTDDGLLAILQKVRRERGEG